MEGRMRVCNMSIEAGARAGLIAPDDTTIEYLRDRPAAPKGAAWDEAVAAWRELRSDDGAAYDRVVIFDAAEIAPQVTWGTNPAQVAPVTGSVPHPDQWENASDRAAVQRALDYMGLAPGVPLQEITIDRV